MSEPCSTNPRVAYLTAGAGGMICGSCLHDNTLVRFLQQLGVDAQLIPTYTPIQTDEEDVSVPRVFLGGINVYLDQFFPFYRLLPRPLRNLLDRPALLRWAARHGATLPGKRLGQLTLSMLAAERGNQRRELEELVSWLKHQMQPDLVIFTNMLIAGCVERLKRELDAPLLVTLQGDDVFLESLPEPYREQALGRIRQLVKHVDGFLVHSVYYADFMADYFVLDPNKIRQVPLGIDVTDFPEPILDRSISNVPAERPLRVGYLARLAPEKGFHHLVDAYLRLKARAGMESVELMVAGWLGTEHRQFADEQFRRLRDVGWSKETHFWGTVDRADKVKFLSEIDILSVPTEYRDPKGLYVLEAMASGVPVVQPAHGVFPELIEASGAGVLVEPGDPGQLADAWRSLLLDGSRRAELGRRGSQYVRRQCNGPEMAQRTWDVCREFL